MAAPVSADAISCGDLGQGRVWRGKVKKRRGTENRAEFATVYAALACFSLGNKNDTGDLFCVGVTPNA